MASSTLYINKPSKDTPNCSNNTCISLTDPVGCGKIGARKSRELVREQLKDYCLLMLGAPVVEIELDQQNLDAAVDMAMMVFEEYAPSEYFNYYVFRTTPGVSVYKMPPDVGLIRNVYYKETGDFGFQGSDIGGALPIEYYYPGGAYSSIQGGLIDPTQPLWGNAGSWALYKGYEYMYTNMSSQIGGWEWIDGLCNIKLYPIPCRTSCVSVHYLQKKYDFKQVNYALMSGAYAFARIILGRIRSKYTQLPGPQGGVQLDGQALLAEGNADLKEWMQDLIKKWGDLMGPTYG